MPQAHRVKTEPEAARANVLGFLRGVLREVGFWLVTVIAGALFVALITFHPEDPAWTHTAQVTQFRNMGGLLGAWFADVSLYFFGYPAYLLPAGLLWGAWRLFMRGELMRLDGEIVLLRALGFIVTLSMACGLAAVYAPVWPGTVPGAGTAGGLVGIHVRDFLIRGFQQPGANLFMVLLLMAGTTLATGLSWIEAVDAIGAGVLKIFDEIGTLVMKPFARWLPAPASTEATADSSNSPDKPTDQASVAPADQAAPTITELSETIISSETPKDVPKKAESTPAAAISLIKQGLARVGTPNTPSAPTMATDQRPPLAEHRTLLAPAPVELPATVSVSLGPDVLTLTPVLSAKTEDAGSTLSPAFVPDVIEADVLAAPPPLPPDMEPKAIVMTTFTPSHTTYLAPPLDLLDRAPPSPAVATTEMLDQMARRIEVLLRHFGIDARVTAHEPGPVITRFEAHPHASLHLPPLNTIANDLAFSLSVPSIRVVEGVPGKQPIWLEVPNAEREAVCLRDILEMPAYTRSNFPLSLALGKDGGGHPVVAHMTRLQHLLLAGADGAEVSGLLHGLLVSLLYKAPPDEMRLIITSAKSLPLVHYNGIPHLSGPVITDPVMAARTLEACVQEVDRRYQLLAAKNLRNIMGLRELAEKEGITSLPFLVIIVAELAELLAVPSVPAEAYLLQLAKRGHAVGVHVIAATQRLSADVLTGPLRVSMPSRIAAQVLWPVDSCTILDHTGADCLLGEGDILFAPPGGTPQRVHAGLVSDREVLRLVSYLRKPG